MLRGVTHTTAYRIDGSPEFAQHLNIDESLLPVSLLEASHLHVLSTSAVSTVMALHPEVPSAGFRPTFLIETDTPGIPENGWLTRRVTIGTAVMVLFGPKVACCLSHQDREPDAAVNMYGVHGIVIEPGQVAVGDVFSVEADE